MISLKSTQSGRPPTLWWDLITADCALSGGVDSSVAAVLLSRAVGTQLTCVFVDHGLLRKDEGDQVESVFGAGGGVL